MPAAAFSALVTVLTAGLGVVVGVWGAVWGAAWTSAGRAEPTVPPTLRPFSSSRAVSAPLATSTLNTGAFVVATAVPGLPPAVADASEVMAETFTRPLRTLRFLMVLLTVEVTA